MPAFLCLAGLFFFAVFGAWRHGVLLIVLGFYFILTKRLSGEKISLADLWLPFASGLLLPLARLFYWDRFDWDKRTGLLLLISLLFSLLRLLQALDAWNRLVAVFSRWSRRQQTLAIFAGTWLLLTVGAVLITQKGVKVAGDEPHYMAIAQSIVRDGDLNVFNQYYRGLYREFLDVDNLPAHGSFGSGEKRIYSSHLPGLPLTIAPFLALHLPHTLLYILLRAYLALFGGLLAVLIYFYSQKLLASMKKALLATILFSLTAPAYFYSLHIFPEIQATLLIMSGLYLLLFPGQKENRGALVAGLLIGASLFWGLKYLLFIGLYIPGFFIHFCRHKKLKKALLLLIFPLIFQALFFTYLHAAYGTFSPNAVYYGRQSQEQSREWSATLLVKIPLRARLETLLDYFFDQRDGLLLYNPLYFFAFPGLILALKKFRRYGPHLLLSLPALAFIANHAFSTIRAGFCPQARYLVPVLFPLLLFAFIYERESESRPGRRLFYGLIGYALFVVAFQVLHPASLYQPTTHDNLWRPGLMFQQWSNLKIDLPGLLPSFIKIDNSRYLPNYIFLVLFLTALILSLIPWQKKRPPLVSTAAGLFLFALIALFPRPGIYNPTRVTPAGGMPFFIFENNAQPRQANDSLRLVSGPGWHHFLIAANKPAAVITIRQKNLAAGGILQTRLLLADAPLRSASLTPYSIQSINLFSAAGIRWQNLAFYPFHLFLQPAAETAEASVTIEFSLTAAKEK